MKRLLFLAALIALIAYLARKAQADRAQWEGLSEDEVRARIDERLPTKIPDDKRQVISDRIVTTMKDRGAFDATVADTIDIADAEADSPVEAEAETTSA